MTLDEARKIKESLEELIPDLENNSWGPCYEFTEQRKKSALKIIRREIKMLKESV